jgi:hypothetical protein
MNKLTLFLLLATFTLVCFSADLPVTEKLVQKTDVTLETHIGGQVFRSNRSSPLPNAFGKRDMFGRKVDRGFIELRYQGQTADGKSLFRLVDIETRSNETTMNRTPITILSGSSQTSFDPYTNTATSRGNAIAIRGAEGRNETLPPNTTEFAIDTTQRKVIIFGEVALTVIEADETSIKYVLSNKRRSK